jgi:hypothetical protein
MVPLLPVLAVEVAVGTLAQVQVVLVGVVQEREQEQVALEQPTLEVVVAVAAVLLEVRDELVVQAVQESLYLGILRQQQALTQSLVEQKPQRVLTLFIHLQTLGHTPSQPHSIYNRNTSL